MGDKKTRSAVESLRSDVQALSEAFWTFRDTIIAEHAADEAEQRIQDSAVQETIENLPAPTAQEFDNAARLLAAVGHPQRLRIAYMLLAGPVSVTQIMETLELSTTGGAYHHLNVLVGNGLAVQEQRGTYQLVDAGRAALTSLLVGLFGEAQPEAPSGKKKKK